MSRKKVTDSDTFIGFSSRLRKVRGKLSQEEFGKILGVTKVSISRYEAGRVPDAETLERIAEYGGVTVDWLLRGDQAGQIEEFSPRTYDTRPAILNLDHLLHALLLARQFLKKRRLRFSDRQELELASYIYEHIESDYADPSETVISRLADLIRRRPDPL